MKLEGLTDAEENLRESLPGTAIEFKIPIESNQDKGNMKAESKPCCFPEVEKINLWNFGIDIAQIQKDNSSEFLEDGKSKLLIQDKNRISA